MASSATWMVFSNKSYAALAAAVAVGFWVTFNILDGILLLSPPAFYYPIPEDALAGFVLSHVTAALLGIVVSMNVYLFRNLRAKGDKTPFLSGSTLGTVSSMCAGAIQWVFTLRPHLAPQGWPLLPFYQTTNCRSACLQSRSWSGRTILPTGA